MVSIASIDGLQLQEAASGRLRGKLGGAVLTTSQANLWQDCLRSTHHKPHKTARRWDDCLCLEYLGREWRGGQSVVALGRAATGGGREKKKIATSPSRFGQQPETAILVPVEFKRPGLRASADP